MCGLSQAKTFFANAPTLMEIAVADQDLTSEWLRSGAVLAAVTGTAQPASGCNCRPLGSMSYPAAASPEFVALYFAKGVGANSLALAPRLVFNNRVELQSRWVRCRYHRHVELQRHTLASGHAFWSRRPWREWGGDCIRKRSSIVTFRIAHCWSLRPPHLWRYCWISNRRVHLHRFLTN